MTFTGTIVKRKMSDMYCATVSIAGLGKFYAETAWHREMYKAMDEMVNMLDREHVIEWENIDEDGNYVEM